MERKFRCKKEFSLLKKGSRYGTLYNSWKVGDILSNHAFVFFDEITPEQLQEHFVEEDAIRWRKFKCIKNIRIDVDYNTKGYEDFKIGDIIDEVEIAEGFQFVSMMDFKEHFQEITLAEDIIKRLIGDFTLNEISNTIEFELYDIPEVIYDLEVSKEEFDYIKKLREEK